MRIVSLVLGVGFVLAFLSVGLSSNKVIGQITSSSSGSTAISLSSNFSGNWKAKVEKIKPATSSSSSGNVISLEAQLKNHGSEHHGETEQKSSSTISLKLCVDSGVLKGTIHQGGVLDKANIISQEVLSENSVSVDLQDKKGITKKATLELVGNNLKITFDDGTVANGRRLNRNGCKLPKPSKPATSSSGSSHDEHPSMGDQGMSGKSNDDGPNHT